MVRVYWLLRELYCACYVELIYVQLRLCCSELISQCVARLESAITAKPTLILEAERHFCEGVTKNSSRQQRVFARGGNMLLLN